MTTILKFFFVRIQNRNFEEFATDRVRLRENGDASKPELILAAPRRVDAACKSFFSIYSSCQSRKPDITQACLRPCTPDALPMMGPIPGFEGAFICAGIDLIH